MRIIRKTPLAKNRKLGISAFVLPVLLATVFLLPGCNMFNKPLSDFLEYWTDVAQISRHSFDGSYPETDGLTNLPAGADRVITYYLVNPQNYVLKSTVTFAHDETLVVDNSTPSDFAAVEQDAADKNIIRLTLKNSVGATGILPLDGEGTDISPTLTITEPNSGRDFGSYTVPVRVNSAPAKVKNAVIMTWNDNSTAKYAVLFYLPTDINNQYSPDRDVVSMTISGFNGQYNETFEIPASGNIGGVENTYTQNDFEPVDSGDSFVPLSGYRFVGIKTDFVVGNVVPSCTVTLRDSSGLESTTDVSTTTTKLTEIYVDPDSGNDSYPGSDILPVKTIGRAMEKLSGMTGTTIILEGDITVPDTLSFTASHPNITLKGGATPVTLTYSGAGRAITVSGGKLTLGENITITDADDGAVEITGGEFVMETDSTLSGNGVFPGTTIPPVYIDGGAVCVRGGIFTMKGGTINSNEADSGGAVYVDGGSFIMSGGTIGKNDATNGGGDVYMDGGTFTMKGGTIQGQGNKKEIYSANTFAITGNPTITDCTVTLEQGARIDVQGLRTDAALTNLQISPAAYTAGEVLLEHATDIAICKKFGLYSPPADGIWWIGPENGNGVLKTIEGTYDESTKTITVPTMPGSKDELQNTVNGSAESGVKVEITGGGTITVGSTVSVPSGADVAIKPDTGSTVDINADGETTVFDVQEGGSLTLGGGYGVVAIIGDPGEQSPVYNDDSPLIKVSGGGTVDIGKNTEIKDNNAGRGVTVSDGGILNMTGGTISGNSGYNGGGGVLIYGKNSNFTMSGGKICDNKLVTNSSDSDPRQGGGVCVFAGAVFTLSGNAEICDNSAQDGGAVCVKDGLPDKKSTFNMYGGTIRDNSSSGVGAVYIRAATAIMYMTGGRITNNTATLSGFAGGIYIQDGTFNGTGAQNASVTGNKIGGQNGTNKDISKTESSTYIPGNVDVGVGP